MPSVAEFAGTLRYRLTVEAVSETGGDAVISHPVEATVWASMRFLAGTERNALVAEAAYSFVVRYRSDWTTLFTHKKRLGLVGTTRKFEIVGAGDPDGQKEQLVITATELV